MQIFPIFQIGNMTCLLFDMYYKKLSGPCSNEHFKECVKHWVVLVCFKTPYKKLAKKREYGE